MHNVVVDVTKKVLTIFCADGNKIKSWLWIVISLQPGWPSMISLLPYSHWICIIYPGWFPN